MHASEVKSGEWRHIFCCTGSYHDIANNFLSVRKPIMIITLILTTRDNFLGNLLGIYRPLLASIYPYLDL